MKITLFFLVLSFLFSCSRFLQKNRFSKFSEYQIQIGCKIFDQNGNLIKNYGGLYCIFEDNGDALIYFSDQLSLIKFDSQMKQIWKISNFHVHHALNKDSSGNYLIMSSELHDYNKKENVRFDRVVVLNKDGQEIKSFSFFEHKDEILKVLGFDYYELRARAWDKELPFVFEFDHLNSFYDFNFEITDQSDVKGGYVLTLVQPIVAVLFLDKDLSKVARLIQPTQTNIHDSTLTSPRTILFFRNSHIANYLNRGNLRINEWSRKEAKVIEYDFVSNTVKNEIGNNLSGYFVGGVQKLDHNLFFISDLGSSIKSKIVNREYIRSMFLDLESGETKIVNFNFHFSKAILINLNSFLSKNIGPS